MVRRCSFHHYSKCSTSIPAQAVDHLLQEFGRTLSCPFSKQRIGRSKNGSAKNRKLFGKIAFNNWAKQEGRSLNSWGLIWWLTLWIAWYGRTISRLCVCVYIHLCHHNYERTMSGYFGIRRKRYSASSQYNALSHVLNIFRTRPNTRQEVQRVLNNWWLRGSGLFRRNNNKNTFATWWLYGLVNWLGWI